MEQSVVVVVGIVLILLFVSLWLRELGVRMRTRSQQANKEDFYKEEIKRLSGENKSIFSKLKQTSLTQSLLLDSLIHINSKLNLNEIQEDIVRAARELMNARQVALFSLQKGTDELTLVSHKGLPSEASRELKYKVGEGKVGCVAMRRVPMMDREFELEANISRAQIDKKQYSFFDPNICAPIVFQTKLLGVIAAADVPGVSEAEKQLLMAIAQASAIALNNAMSFEQLQDFASVDGLTKLYNVQFFRERLREEVKRAQRFQHPFSVIIMDVDNFKNYNDTHGHLMGDRLLVQFASIIKKALRETDLVSRYGGDEFIILCPETDKQHGEAASERMRKLLEEFPFPHRTTQPLGLISISVGVSTYPEDGLHPEELIKSADEALYNAKRLGRNRVIASKPVRLKEL